jgi:hypothetical protein
MKYYINLYFILFIIKDESNKRLIEKLRNKLNLFEEENFKLTNEIEDLSKENEKTNNELRSLFKENKNKEINFSSLINEKDSLIRDLGEKINLLEINIENYEDKLNEIIINYDKNIIEYQNEIGKKNEEIKFLYENHAKEIKDVFKIKFFSLLLIYLLDAK